MRFPRGSGILLHLTSLPGRFGIGDLGPSARSFADQLAAAGQTYWQVLPLGPTGFGDSPYQCFSAFAGNTLLISPEELVRDGLLDEEKIKNVPEFSDGRVDFAAILEWKTTLLQTTFSRWMEGDDEALRAEYQAFVRENNWWLADYAFYRAVKMSQEQSPWYEWPFPLKLRETGALAALSSQLAAEIQAETFFQFIFFRQWKRLKSYVNALGIRIIGDMPIFVALDSADVWCDQAKFKLNSDGSPKVVAGVPPDYFSKTGQLWGNPIYDHETMRRDGFHWWVARMAFALKMYDIVRIDHFRGFCGVWEVPGGEKTAENGEWVTVPGNEIFTAIQKSLGQLPVIAEDLGDITQDVRELRDRFGFPGMKILQYAFGGDAANEFLPHNFTQNTVVYTGTHDNETAVGWWLSRSGNAFAKERRYCRHYVGTDMREPNWALIRAAISSVADIAIVPMQDALGLGNEARMNTPATDSGNWTWRMKEKALTPYIARRLRDLAATYGRLPIIHNLG